jgi:hypothetical protein
VFPSLSYVNMCVVLWVVLQACKEAAELPLAVEELQQPEAAAEAMALE